ncbi:unnamed protein product [Prorocentrum cordatum]|uniref:Uncharacterized protein n=1 Tax=Prorocentrum cordatum TaxID=2364126 RepID=A0ABN9RX08_9DINO|nr:unnamed protein product [Polarella glacialis]
MASGTDPHFLRLAIRLAAVRSAPLARALPGNEKRWLHRGRHLAQDTEIVGISRKDRLMTKLLLQREANFSGSARDQNVVVRLKVGSQMQMALAASTAHYQKVGKEARDTVAAADYGGHPLGKKPDAYLRMLLFRLSESVEARYDEVKAAVAQGPHPQESASALTTLVEFGKSLKDPEVRLKATRCFDVRVTTTIDGEEVEEAKWIFAAVAHPAVMAAMYALKTNGGLKSVSLILEDDEAPRSKAAKELEKLVFRGGGNGSQGKQKRANTK